VILELIQMATTTEKEWLPMTRDPAAQPILTDAGFTSSVRDLARNEAGSPIATAVMINKAEDAGWLGVDRVTGHWAAFLRPQTRDSSDVGGNGDYPARRYKLQETGHLASGTRAPTPAGGSSTRSGEITSRSATGKTATAGSAAAHG
jgi:hypothetical protein